MSIKRSTDLEQSSSQQHVQADIRPQQDDQAPPMMSQQQEQQYLQLYWHGSNDNHGESRIHDDDEEETLLHSWASRTFSATCYKFTIQNDPALRHQGPLYSFLENWQLHTMYNKSQKILLGIADRRPCVLLTGDDFMFTPPPLKDDDDDDPATAIYQQTHTDGGLDDDDEKVGGGGGTSGGMDEHLWMLYQPTMSPLHVVNGSDDDVEDDLLTGEQEPTMVMGRDQIDARATSAPSAHHQKQQLVSPALVKWYQTVEHPTIIQRRPSTIMMDHDETITTLPTETIATTTSHADAHASTLIADQENDDDDDDDDNNTITSTDNASSTTRTVLTWRQWLQQGMMFLSQRMVEVAYLVAELAESLATTTTNSKEETMLMSHSCQEDRLKAADNASNKVMTGGGHYIVQVFRVWRVFFLGVETMMHRLFSLDSSSSSSPRITVLPLLTKSSSTF